MEYIKDGWLSLIHISKEAGAGMTKGLTGAGLNALLQKELGKIKAPEVHKMASAAIGYLEGGKTGTAIAHQATTFNYLTHEQYKQYLDDMKNAKTEEEKKRLQKDWEAIDERQRYSPISTPGTYWDLKTGRPFTVKEGGNLFEPVLVTATRAHGETTVSYTHLLQAGMNARDIQKNQKTDKAINKNNAVGINISLGSTGWKDHAETITEETKGSRITAGRTAAVIAKEDMTVKGSTVNAQDIHLTAGNNIHILSSENKSTTIEDYKAKSGSIGASLSKGGYGIGASYGKGKGQIEETTITHTPSDITAKDTASLSSGNDTTIKGGIIKGNKVTADIGRNLSIESEQDKKNYKETSKTSGLSISYTPGSAVTVSGGKGKTNTDSTYESVTKQAGIYAGKEGYDIQVKNNTRLKGAVIDSQAEKEKNKLTTGALTWENIENLSLIHI